MAPNRALRHARNLEQQRSHPQAERVRPQGIKTRRSEISPRKSARLAEIQCRQERVISKDETSTAQRTLLSPTGPTSGKESPRKVSNPPHNQDRKRRRPQEAEEQPDYLSIQHPPKRLQTSAPGSASGHPKGQSVADNVADIEVDPILYWIQNQRWAKEYFEQDDQVRQDFKNDFEKDSWYEKHLKPGKNKNDISEMNDLNQWTRLLARKRSTPSVGGKQPGANAGTISGTTPSDEKPRVAKSTTYQDPRYVTYLATKGSFMRKSEFGVTESSKALCRTLLDKEQPVPQESLFRDDIFDKTCENMQKRNEARIVQDITRLLVPSAETLAVFGAKSFDILVESVNEGWNNSMPITDVRPQPDYAVGFAREAFTDDQLERLGPFTGGLMDTSYLMGTYYMYFPFLTCEVKCGSSALDIADRQNAHSMTMAVKGIVELFKLVKREKELHREILAFSFSHDHQSVRIYGHYPVIEGWNITYYRHPIKSFDFTSEEGKEKWAAYRFTKNVYDVWMPTHFERICSAIADLPIGLDFEVPELSERGFSGLSQGLGSHRLSDQLSRDGAQLEEIDSRSSHVGSQDATPNTSLSQRVDGVFKRSSKRARPGE